MMYCFILGPYLNLVYIIGVLPYDPTFGSGDNTSVASDTTEDFKTIAIQYLRMTFVCGYLDFATFMISKYFAIQGYTRFVYIVSLVMIVSQIIAHYFLVSVLGLALNGIGLAAFIGRIVPLSVCVTIWVVMVRKGEFVWSGVSVELLKGWAPMVKLGISGAVNVFAETCLLEIATFCSQFDGQATLSTVLISFQIISMIWAVTNGMCCAATTLIGESLGQGDREKVKSYIIISILNVVGVAVPLALLAYCFRRLLVQIFSREDSVVSLFTDSFWLACLGMPFDHLQVVLNRGILTAFGEQKFIAWSISIISFTIGLPVILITIFLTDMKVIGIFLGFLTFYIANVTVATVRMSQYTLEDRIAATAERVSLSGKLTKVQGMSDTTCESNLDVTDIEGTAMTIKTKQETEKEVKNVVFVFFICVLWCVVLTAVSFINQ